jgi:hypothetical protein
MVLLTLILTSGVLWKIKEDRWRREHGIEGQPVMLQQPVHVFPELKQLSCCPVAKPPGVPVDGENPST